MTCSIDNCDREVYARRLCSKHYQRRQRTGDPNGVGRGRWRERGLCSIEDCGKPHFARGWCSMHYARWQTHGDPLKGARREAGTHGARFPDKGGYMLVYFPEHPNALSSGNVREHVLVMSEHLGRPLLKSETVHHINGVRDDNRIENLELWSSSHPSGQRVEDKLAWAREIIDLYGSLDQHH